MDSHQKVKLEKDTSNNYEDFYTDVKVEDHPIEIESKQDNDLNETVLIDMDPKCMIRQIDTNENDIYCPVVVKTEENTTDIETSLLSSLTKPNINIKYSKVSLKYDLLCIRCDYSTLSRIDFEKHMQNHTEEKTYHCKHCDKNIPCKSAMAHYKEMHRKMPFLCSYCEKRYTDKIALLKHERMHTEEKLFQFQCNQCEGCFAEKRLLVKHIEIHTGDKAYQCQSCESNFANRSSLASHKRIHTGEKPYQCRKCEKSFAQKNSLLIHQKTHSGEKPYQCNDCKMCFAQRGSLISHQKTHTGEKPYQCSHCEKYFAHKQNLVSHQKIHFREIS